jgi:heme-degrading monooxygenase HmoA
VFIWGLQSILTKEYSFVYMESMLQEGSDILAQAGFVAINTITCKPEYVQRFEELFGSRVGAIDEMEGFLAMRVLKSTEEGPYLVVSFWKSEDNFKNWVGSEAFHKGHARAFEDLKAYKERGEEPPMHSAFHTYTIIAK